jgi:two-component system response regulator WspF
MIETIHRFIAPLPGAPVGSRDAPSATRLRLRNESLVCIGSSAGGPAALACLLAALPADFPAAVVIVQHVDAQFAQGLADWLGSQTRLPVRVAHEGETLQPGVVLLAGRDHHLVLLGPRRLGYVRAAADCACHPSVDIFFNSVAEHRTTKTIGVLLTGMGRDGANGLLALRERGFLTISQDQATSAVFGMPKAAADLKAAVEILALDKIAPRLVNVLMSTA